MFGLVVVFITSGLLGLPACLLADSALRRGVGYGWIFFAGAVYGAAIGLSLDAAFFGILSDEPESLPAFTISCSIATALAAQVFAAIVGAGRRGSD